MVEHPTLHVGVERGRVFVRGTLLLRNDGIEIDHYQVEIEVPECFPEDLPIVREVGGKLPKVRDRHFNPENGEACILLPDERDRHFPSGASLMDFIRGSVENFFLAQTYYDKTGKWLSGQWSHGADGICEYYAELLGTDDRVVIRTCIEYLAKKELKGHWRCYCGNGKPLRSCHLAILQDLRTEISYKVALRSLEKLDRQGSQSIPLPIKTRGLLSRLVEPVGAAQSVRPVGHS